MIFVLVFSALAVSIATLSGTNLQIADNRCKANRALGCAESGLDILRFWLGRIYMPVTTQPGDRFGYLANFLQTDLTYNGAIAANGIKFFGIAIEVSGVRAIVAVDVAAKDGFVLVDISDIWIWFTEAGCFEFTSLQS